MGWNSVGGGPVLKKPAASAAAERARARETRTFAPGRSAASARGGAGVGPGGALGEWPGREDHVMLGFRQPLGRPGPRGLESECRITDFRMGT